MLVNNGILIFSMLHDARNLIRTLLKEKNSRWKIFVKYVFDKTQYKDVPTLKKIGQGIKTTQHIKCNIKLRRRNDTLNSSTEDGIQTFLF